MSEKPITHRAEPVAIVGMATLFPKSPDLATYWGNIVAARDCIDDIPAGHSWRPDDHWSPEIGTRDKTYSRRGGFLDPVPFDPMQHGITPNALDATDTSQLLGLIVARECLRDAGVDPDGEGWDRARVGVVLGVTGTQELAITLGARLQGPKWRRSMLRCGVDPALADAVVSDISDHFPEWQEQSFPGLLGNVVAGRIANRLNLGGTNCVVDAACASSLAAVQLALADLHTGRADMVLSGGVDTLNDIFMYMCFSATPALSHGDDARPFDAAADGILISEGIAVMALKRVSDAERDGDRIYAVIKGIGSSSDGRGKSIYAPAASGQVKAVRRALEAAGAEPASIGLIEAHGTGTRAGDAAEMEGLRDVFAGVPGKRIAVGSVKSQIGHTKSTAGAAGLVKAAMALHERVLPPTAKVDAPNPKIDFADTPLYLNTHARPWVHAGEHPRRAGVSAFGFGGSNFHCVLEEHGPATARPRSPAAEALVLVGAPTAAALVARLEQALAGLSDAATVHHAARSLLIDWSPSDHVVATTADSVEVLRDRLQTAIALVGDGPGERAEVWYGVPTAAHARLAVLFPGQGSQYVDMCRTLALRHPEVRAALDRADSAFAQYGREPLSGLIYPPPAFDDDTRRAQQAALTATEWAQPAIGAVSKGMWDVLAGFGVAPEAAAGHSYGELVALAAAGVLDEASLWTASLVRGQAMANDGRDRGTMAAVSGSLADIEAAVSGHDVVLANRNHPRQGVISGSRDAVAGAVDALAQSGLSAQLLPVSAAFHSPLVADAREPFAAALDGLPFHEPAFDVYSTVTAAPYTRDEAATLLAGQITSPVDWVGVLEALYDRGVRTFVECGPGRVLCGLARHTLNAPDVTVVALDGDRHKVDGDTQLKRALARLAVRGVPIDVAPLLAEPLPPEPRKAGSKATVWLSGANYRTERTQNPPAPALPAAAPPPAEPDPGVPAVAEDPADTSSGGGSAIDPTALAALLETTRDSLAAFQQAQERTARVHERFIQSQAEANAGFQRLFDTHARLVELALGGDPASLPAPRPVAAPIAPTAPTSVRRGLSEAGDRVLDSFLANPDPLAARGARKADVPRLANTRVGAPAKARPAVAADDDLPPLMVASGAGMAVADLPTRAPDAAPSVAVDLVAPTLAAVAEKTGYPADMLELSMDMESDLGIDSIKRVEILAAVKDAVPSLPELDNEALAALRTLGDVVQHLEGLLGAPSAAPARDLVGATFAAVAEKTGYPADMLDLSMDMESDLGIDSIKRVEILAAVKDAVPSLPELDNEALAALRTLGDVVQHLEGLLGAPSAAPARDLVGATFAAVAEKTGYPADMLDLSMDMESDLGIDSIKRVEILAAVKDAVPSLPELDNEALAALRTLGDVVDHLGGLVGAGGATAGPAAAPAPAPAPTGARDTAAPPARRVVDVVAAPRGRPFSPGRLAVVGGAALGRDLADELRRRGVDAFTADPDWIPVNGDTPDSMVVLCALDDAGAAVHRAFALARAVGPRTLFATVTAQGGTFGHQGLSGSPLAGALAGLVKTLDHEWPATRCLAIDVDRPDAVALASEVITDRGIVEVGLRAGEALGLSVREAPALGAESRPVEGGDLVVVSGGARGVTAAVVVELARRWQPALLLLGRSPLAPEPDWAREVADEALTAACLADARARGDTPSPRELSAAVGRVLAGREIATTLATLREAGSDAAYVSADVRDARAVATAISDAVRRHGPVRGVIHGAGVIADKHVEDKTDAQFDRVFGTKVEGWAALAGAVDPDGLRFAAMFASVAGRYGNIGQCDYAMANEALTRFALQLSERGVRAKSFSWGPWEGGMVTPALRRQLEARGMSLIPLQSGAELFCDELAGGGPAVEVVVGGPEGGGALLRADNGRVAHTLRRDRDPFLVDHRIDGKPVLPAVMVLEWMARAARRVHPGLRFAGLREFTVLKGVVVEDAVAQVTLRWTRAEPRDAGGAALAFELVGEPGKLGPTVHYRAIVDLTAELPAPRSFPGSNGLGSNAYPYSVDEAYRRFLFHGPGLQGIEAIEGISDHGMVARLRTSRPDALGEDGEAWVTDPLALDSLLQLMVLWVREKTGAASLPCAVGDYRQYAPLDGPVTCHLEVTPGTGGHGSFRATLVDAAGQVVATLARGEYTASRSLNQAFRRASA